MKENTKGYFDRMSAGWDENPANVRRAEAVAAEIRSRVPLSPLWDVLEYGSGTGLLSFILGGECRSFTLADDSEGMLSAARDRIRSSGVENMRTVRLNLERDPYGGRHDLVLTSMAMHHVRDTAAVISKFFAILRENGWICIADLMPEDGTFHKHMADFDGHNGLDPEALARQLHGTGFTRVTSRVFYSIERVLEGGISRKYDVFLISAKKPPDRI